MDKHLQGIFVSQLRITLYRIDISSNIMVWFTFAATFLICIMGQISVSVVITAWILNIYHHSDDKPVPKWMKRLILEWIATMLCLKCGPPKAEVSPLKLKITNNGDSIIRTVASVLLKGDDQSPQNKDNETTLSDYMCAYVLHCAEKEESVVISDQNKSDWQSVARVLDRLFLIVFLLATIIAIVAYFIKYLPE